LEDDKDEELEAPVKKNIEESRQVEQRRCRAEERRLSLEERSLEFAREKHQEEVAKRASDEAARRMSLASDASAAAAERELRVRQLDIMTAVLQSLDEDQRYNWCVCGCRGEGVGGDRVALGRRMMVARSGG